MADEAASELRRQIGKRIRIARYAFHGKDRQEFLNRTGISRQALHRYESGTEWPNFLFVLTLWKEYRITTDWIIRGEMYGVPDNVATRLREQQNRE